MQTEQEQHSRSDKHAGQPDKATAAAKAAKAAATQYPPLAAESRITVDTETAAHHLTRKPQTLRGWACHGNGPLRPVRIHGRLAWPVADLIRLQHGASVH